jgi:gamma-glutamylcyclotransferase (GGCT)/AIG2-like uncharacterized protein YtfP
MPFLFSYGDLQQEKVQVSTLGRRLQGKRDELVGWEECQVAIENPEVAATLGKTHHRNLRCNGIETNRVPGMVFEVTDAELARIDEFEARFAYRRVLGKLTTGGDAWVFVYEGNTRRDPPS